MPYIENACLQEHVRKVFKLVQRMYNLGTMNGIQWKKRDYTFHRVGLCATSALLRWREEPLMYVLFQDANRPI